MGVDRSPQSQRRTDDCCIELLFASPEDSHSLESVPELSRRTPFGLHQYLINDDLHIPRGSRAPGSFDPGGAVFLLDLGAENAILIAGSAISYLPRGPGGDDLLSRGAQGAAAWRRERIRTWKRQQLPEKLLTFAEQLHSSDTVEKVCATVTQRIVEVVNGYTALMFVPQPGGRETTALHTPLVACGDPGLRITPSPHFSRAGLIFAHEAQEGTGGPYAGLASLFTQVGAAMLAHVPCGTHGVLVLVERRQNRTFDPDDWDLLRSFATQAAAALERISLIQEVRTLSLTDPLTGVGNRRRLNLFLEHAWPAARRGEPLTAAMIDLDNFKRLNDQHGHKEGDRFLRMVAEALRSEARGSDLVVRYGGDEFLVLFPRESAESAQAFLDRVRKRLAGLISFSAGIAANQPTFATPEDLIEAADSDLYRAKRGRGARI
ncbi:MAG TPA: sensor domain-containing diguanylate cyclase [Longimicrobiaceae bacterium]|nr:sensor domain-containing diguanylate cyclase [Longimicrobiaceae bacterium]